MKAFFGLKADDYDELPTFVGGEKETPEEIRNLVIGEFLRLHKTSQHITSANEATRCEFPVSFMVWHQYMKVNKGLSPVRNLRKSWQMFC
jgi:hypothetical protein